VCGPEIRRRSPNTATPTAVPICRGVFETPVASPARSVGVARTTAATTEAVMYEHNDTSASTKTRKPRSAYDRMLQDVGLSRRDGILVYNTDRRRLQELAGFLERRGRVAVPYADIIRCS